jgi:hypothetical protein
MRAFAKVLIIGGGGEQLQRCAHPQLLLRPLLRLQLRPRISASTTAFGHALRKARRSDALVPSLVRSICRLSEMIVCSAPRMPMQPILLH